MSLQINDVGIDRIRKCVEIKDSKERSACLWQLIYDTEVFIDEIRKYIPGETEIEPVASKIVERCVDISREVAKGMKNNNPDRIDWGYIREKFEKLDTDIKWMRRDIEIYKERGNEDLIRYRR